MSSTDECWTAMALTLNYKHRIILLATENLMWTRCTSSSEKKKKLEVFETRINHFKSCKTSLFLLFPFYSALSASLRGNRLGNCKNPTQIPPSPTSDKSYLNCSHFSRSQQTTVSGLFEKKGKKTQVSSLCGAFAICDTTAIMKYWS